MGDMQETSALSRRERQIMEVIYTRGQASANEVLAGLADPPSYSAVRTLLGILEQKGYVRHIRERGKYIYLPTTPRDKAGQDALQRVLQTYYDGSLAKAAAALFDASERTLSEDEVQRLTRMIAQAKEEGR
ncbi:MAG TPA: BlaI/MecI/CopY family transcriptional regulator [Armatimonadota bacterium]